MPRALFLVLISTFLFVQANAGCPDGYSTIKDSTSCFKLVSTPMAKSYAEVTCNNDEGYLASIDSAFVNTFIFQLGQQASAAGIWFGLECTDTMKSSCRNDDQTPFGQNSYSNFAAGYPSSSLGRCTYLSVTQSLPQKWYSYDCKKELAFVCELPVTQANRAKRSLQ